MADETMTWAELAERDPELFVTLLRLHSLPDDKRREAYATAKQLLDAALRWQEGEATEEDVELLDHWSYKVDGKSWAESVAEREAQLQTTEG